MNCKFTKLKLNISFILLYKSFFLFCPSLLWRTIVTNETASSGSGFSCSVVASTNASNKGRERTFTRQILLCLQLYLLLQQLHLSAPLTALCLLRQSSDYTSFLRKQEAVIVCGRLQLYTTRQESPKFKTNNTSAVKAFILMNILLLWLEILFVGLWRILHLIRL